MHFTTMPRECNQLSENARKKLASCHFDISHSDAEYLSTSLAVAAGMIPLNQTVEDD